MSDLISRKAVLDIIQKEIDFGTEYDADYALIDLKDVIAEMPTAYSVEKVVAELEEEKKYCSYHPHTRDEAINKSIEIVNQLAEEYNNESVKGDLISRSDVMRMLTNIELSCTIIPITEAKSQLRNIPSIHQTYNNGWIPCSERLPEEDGKQYMVEKTNGLIDILEFTKDAYKLDKYDFVEYKGKKKQLFYDYDSEYGFIEYECEAWQPLPPKYEPKGE